MAGIDGFEVKTIFDLGISSHMVGSKALLKAPFTSVKQSFVLGDSRSVFSETSGCAVISCSNVRDRPRSFVLKDVLLVSTLDATLPSCAEMEKNGHEVTFRSAECQLKPAGEQESTVIGKLRSGVYALIGKLGTHEKSRAARNHRDPTGDVLWHNRMGHVGTSTVPARMKHRSVKGFRLDESEDKSSCCECFLYGKQTRSSPKEPIQKATEAGEIIHSDVCGPMPVASISHKRYFVIFIDAWSGFKMVSLMFRKSEVLQKFKDFEAMFERRFDVSIKNFYSDNGGEYEGMLNYFSMMGIIVRRAATYTPEQNRVAERTNRTVMDMARSMPSHSGLSAQFWGEAVTTAADICTHVGTRECGMKTPLELLTGKKPYVGHFKTFGCQVMVHIPKQLRSKLGRRSKEAVLPRFLPHSIFCVCYTDTQTVQHVRHAIVNENVFPVRSWDTECENDVQQLQIEVDGYNTDVEIPELIYEFEDYDDAESDIEEEDSGEAEDAVQGSAVNDTVDQGPTDDLTYTPGILSQESIRYPFRDRRSPKRLALSAKSAHSGKGFQYETLDLLTLQEALSREEANE